MKAAGAEGTTASAMRRAYGGVPAWVAAHPLTTAATLILIAWTAMYFATTSISPRHGGGGLSGPVTVRMFASVGHLVAFYPHYVVERVLRNGSLTSANHAFNCDFVDQDYKWSWLYGDGKYSAFWSF